MSEERKKQKKHGTGGQEEMGERVFYEKRLILGLLKRRFLETALNNTDIASSDIGTVYEDSLERVESWIDEVPPADVKPVVRGEWIYHPEAAWKYECNRCGSYVPGEWKYCPECGSYNGCDAE